MVNRAPFALLAREIGLGLSADETARHYYLCRRFFNLFGRLVIVGVECFVLQMRHNVNRHKVHRSRVTFRPSALAFVMSSLHPFS